MVVGARGLADSVVPGIDNEGLELTGADSVALEEVRRALFDRSVSRGVWSQPTLPMELRQYVDQLVQRGELYMHLRFERDRPELPVLLTGATWLAPETLMLRRAAGGEQYYEQFVSRYRFAGDAVAVEGQPRDQLVAIPQDEVLRLQWPLPLPNGSTSPAWEVSRLGRRAALHSRRTLLNARAGLNDGERFLPLARARAGAFADALDQQKSISARIKDTLAYPGAYEAEVFPWVDEATDYFRADRILVARIAICRLRSYLFEQFNEQVLHRWCRRNGWGEVSLALRSDVFSEEEWADMRQELARGALSLDDARAAVAVEAECAQALDS